jgi:glycosyltransferase involved in cell wall biosynthesis
MRFCTVIASNYLSYARVLAASLRTHHPDDPFSVLVIDPAPVDTAGDDLEVLRPADIGLDGDEFRHMAAIYSVVELATAVKAALLRSLLDIHGEPVCYLDPDIEVFGHLEGLGELVERHGMVLTPHTTTPYPRDGKHINEQGLLIAGLYNLGFIAVSAKARPFIDWWDERLRRDCRVDVENGVFVDQRWVDLASTCFDHASVSDPGWNVAYWNLHGRAVAHTTDGYLVNGRPLRFFHFSGFSPLQPHRLSKHQREAPRIQLADHPAVARLCTRYARKLLAAGYLDTAAAPYRYDVLGNGLPLDARMRDLYRIALSAAEAGRGAPPPDPFDPVTADDFVDWLCLPRGTTGDNRIPRYFRRIYDERPDLQVAFQDLGGAKGDEFLEWMRLYGEAQSSLPAWCSRIEATPPAWPPSALDGHPTTPGVNVVGYLRAENGVGEVARQLLDSLACAEIPSTAIAWKETPARQNLGFDAPEVREYHDVNVICVNADQLRRLAGAQLSLPRARRTIGIWAWEVSHFPAWMRRSAALVDEVWTFSRHSAEAIGAVVDVPVHVFAPPITTPALPGPVDRRSLGLREGFLFLFCFDYFSVFERKNPLAAVEAFVRAFTPGEGPQLVIKSVNAAAHPIDAARLQAAVHGRPDITVIDGYFDRERQATLMAACDAYVSLHRAEGYGLTLLEAMAMGKPVVATGYSGNLEFMTPANSHLVPYAMTTVPLGCMPYPPGAEWADPDLDAAAQLLRDLAENPAAAAGLGAIAREDVRTRHSPATRAAFLRGRLVAPAAKAPDEAVASEPAGAGPGRPAEPAVIRRPFRVGDLLPRRDGTVGPVALNQLQARLERAEQAVRDRDSDVAALRGRQATWDDTLAAADVAVNVATAQVACLDERLRRLEMVPARLDALERRLAWLQAEVERTGAMAASAAAAAEELDALAPPLRELRTELVQLTRQVRPNGHRPPTEQPPPA